MRGIIVWIVLCTTLLIASCGGGGSQQNETSPERLPSSSPTDTNTPPTANAGEDQTVIESSVVTLAGSGVDSEGNIDKYEWQQVAGISVEMSNADDANTTFTAPAIEQDAVLRFLLTVTDDAGASHTDDVQVTVKNITADMISLSGELRFENVEVTAAGYDYQNITFSPIRAARVNLLDKNNNVIQTTFSDSDGHYMFNLAAPGTFSVEVKAEMNSDDEANAVFIKDNLVGNDNTLLISQTKTYSYSVRPLMLIESDIDDANFTAKMNWDPTTSTYESGRNAPVFALLDQAYDMHLLLRDWDDSYRFDPLYILWNENNKAESGVWWKGEIGNSHFAGYGEQTLYVLSDTNVNLDEYDKTIIGHELGHYILNNLARNESIGGSHSLQSVMDPRQAFVEGFASYFSWLLTGSEELIDADGLPNGTTLTADIFMRPNDTFNKGWFFQTVNADVLKNVTLGNPTYELEPQGFDFVFDVIQQRMKQSDALISIHSFLGNVLKASPALTEPLSAFANNKGITSVDEWADGETFQVPDFLSLMTHQHRYLPLYREMELGTPIEICLDDPFAGSGNRLGVYAYLTLEIEEQGNYLVEWASPDGVPSVSTRNHLGERYLSGGGVDDNAESNLAGSYLESDVPAEFNIVTVSFYGNEFPGADPRAPRVEQGCITLTISKVD